ncbi:MAG: SdrD B-like domain-containing protein [Pseudomonadota bacterium]
MRLRSSLLAAGFAVLSCAYLSVCEKSMVPLQGMEAPVVSETPTAEEPETPYFEPDRPETTLPSVEPQSLPKVPAPSLKPNLGASIDETAPQEPALVASPSAEPTQKIVAVEPVPVARADNEPIVATDEAEQPSVSVSVPTIATPPSLKPKSPPAEPVDAPEQPKVLEIEDDEALEAAPEKAYSVEHVDMIIEGALTSVRSRYRDETDRQFNLTDIAPALRSKTELHETLLGYHRGQDGTLMSINMEDGKVRSNRTVLGRLPNFEPREVADPWISLNAITIMTGTHASEDEQGRTVLTLDEQLKPQFGLELWVNGVPVDTFGNEPRTLGPILLVPLEPVVDALGHDLTVTDGTVTVRRQQDQMAISLELATGLVSVNTTPRGITPDMELAERDTLVLPFGAVESLTGTHIKLVPMTNRVEVNLDNRLDSTALPGADVAEQARNTPLTLESVSYQVTDRGPLRAEARGYVGKYNFRTQVETAGGLDTLAPTQPAWMSADIASLDGWNATVGDYNSSFRELSGVGANRIRGASWRKQRENGDVLAIAAGLPLTGSETASETVSVPTFGGFAAGARVISQDQSQDIGLAASLSENGDNASVVANGQKSFRFDDTEDGLRSAFIAADVGVFAGEAAGADIRLRGSANYAVSDQTGISVSGAYEGAKFAAGAQRPNFEGVFNQSNGARTNVAFGANWRADEPMLAFNRLAVSTRASARHEGGDADSLSTALSAALNAQIGENGPTISTIVQRTDVTGAEADQTATSIRLRGTQRLKRGSLSVSYTYNESDDAESVQQMVATAQANPLRKRFENGASVQVAPNATFNWDGESTRLNAGATAVADSGEVFGSKLDLQGRLSAFSNFASEDENATNTRFLGSVEARYALHKNAQITAVYTDDFNGRSDFSIGLRGTKVFNPPRASRLPDDGKGVLNGRVFLDQNRDGIRQEDEPGIPGVRVMLIGTRIGLNSGNDGYFTIQNIRQGLYAVTVSRQSLPLGYLVPETAQPRVTVGSGRRTDVDIPLILSGQVRGAIFIDDNANGTVDPGEERLEGQWVSLIPADGGEPLTIHSASFGQYGFESVDPGEYTLQTTISGQPIRQDITVDGKNPFVIAPIPIPPGLAASGGGLDLSAGVLGEP